MRWHQDAVLRGERTMAAGNEQQNGKVWRGVERKYKYSRCVRRENRRETKQKCTWALIKRKLTKLKLKETNKRAILNGS